MGTRQEVLFYENKNLCTHNGNDVLVKDLENAVKETYKAHGFKASKIKTLDIYYVPDKPATYAAITDEDGKVTELVVEPKAEEETEADADDEPEKESK